MKTILVAGGSGLIGRKVCKYLSDKGFEVKILTRSIRQDISYPQFVWSPAQQFLDTKALEGIDYILNLAGEGIAEHRWTEAAKKQITKSRTDSNQLFFNTLKESSPAVKGYFSAAAIGYYGDRGEERLDEKSSASGKGFLSQSCIEWENSIRSIETLGIPTTWFRIGLVLDKDGGALPHIASPLKFGVNPYFGDGNQYYSWIHIEDICKAIHFSIENNMNGAINLTAPNPVRNIVFTKLLEGALKKVVFPFSIPRILLKLLLGEKAALVLDSNYVLPRKLLDAGFEFSFPTLDVALKDIYKWQ